MLLLLTCNVLNYLVVLVLAMYIFTKETLDSTLG
jgi:hypothetical protein